LFFSGVNTVKVGNRAIQALALLFSHTHKYTWNRLREALLQIGTAGCPAFQYRCLSSRSSDEAKQEKTSQQQSINPTKQQIPTLGSVLVFTN
jgi:hypothetical protein